MAAFDNIIVNNSGIINALIEDRIWLTDAVSETGNRKKFCCHRAAVAMATNTYLLNSVN